VQGEAMVERPLHRTPTCLSGEWDAVQDRAPQGGPSLSTAIACEMRSVESGCSAPPLYVGWGCSPPRGGGAWSSELKSGRDLGLGKSGAAGVRSVQGRYRDCSTPF